MDEQLIFDDINKIKDFIDATYLLSPREKESVDRIVYRIAKNMGIVQKYFPTVQIPKGAREHSIFIETEMSAPVFDDDWTREDLDEVRKEKSTFYPIFMHKDYRLTKVDIDASRSLNQFNIDAQTFTLRGATSTMAIYKEKVNWRGYDITGRGETAANWQGSIDSKSKGILNTSGIQTFDCGDGGDSDIQAAGDGPSSIGKAAADLIPYHYDGPYWVFLSPQVKIKLLTNKNATTFELDIERMQSMVDEKGNKILRGIDTSHYLLNGAEATNSANKSAMIFIDPMTPSGEPTILLGKEYEIQHMPVRQDPSVIRGKVVWAGIPMVLRPKAITVDMQVIYA